MKPTSEKIIQFNTILGSLGLQNMKRDMIAGATNGRTDHTKQMQKRELDVLIDHLNRRQSHTNYKQGNYKRRRILSLCHQLPIELGFTKWDEIKSRRIVNMAKLNKFLCGKKSIFKKKLNYHTPSELSRVIVQFEHILKGYLKK